MTTSVNQPRPVTQVRSGGLFRVIGILALIVISVAWLLNSYKAGQPIALSQPLPKAAGVDPSVEQTVTFELAPPERCVNVSKPVVAVAGNALKIPTDYVPCSGHNASTNVAYKLANGPDGYTLVDSDGDKFLCAVIPHEAADIAQCKAVQ